MNNQRNQQEQNQENNEAAHAAAGAAAAPAVSLSGAHQELQASSIIAHVARNIASWHINKPRAAERLHGIAGVLMLIRGMWLAYPLEVLEMATGVSAGLHVKLA